MRSTVAVAIVVVAACGDDAIPVLYPAPDLVVVAHQDDDLLFMQPDVFELVSERQPITVVYVTAGDGGNGLEYVAARKTAIRAAYSAVAGSKQWTCASIEIANHAAEHCRLADRDVSLVFLDYPDGGLGGEAPASLLRLWQGTIAGATTLAEVPTTYDRDELIETVASIIYQTRPHILRTLEVAGTHGDDHSDHMMTGALAQLALAQTPSEARLIAYRGYNINYEPPNLSEDTYQQVSLFMRAYAACMTGCGVCGETPCPTVEDARLYNFLHRHYTVETRSTPLTTVLSSSAGCVGRGPSDMVELVACDVAPAITLEPNGLLRIADDCVEARADGRLVVDSCTHAPQRHFELDDEGHLWSGLVATPSSSSLYNHTSCVHASGGRLQADTCGADRDWRWQLVR